MTACGDVTRVSFPRSYVVICFRLLWLSSGHVVVWLLWLRVTTACGDVKVRFGLPLTSRFLWLATLSKRNIRRWHVKRLWCISFASPLLWRYLYWLLKENIRVGRIKCTYLRDNFRTTTNGVCITCPAWFETRASWWIVSQNLMFIGPCIIVIVDEWKTNLMSLANLFHLLCLQHVSDISISIFRSLRLCWWITTSVVLFCKDGCFSISVTLRCVVVCLVWCALSRQSTSHQTHHYTM